jgi:outer membrane protein OmpA-like peptidoglycan-associated protein
MKKILIALCCTLVIVGLLGCGMSKRDQGALIGAGAGAVAGGVIGKQAGNTAAGAIIGAMIGGAAGAYIGNYMDKQAAEIEKDIEGAKVERIGEGIKITFASGILFDVNKAELRSEAYADLTNLARILQKHEDTEILVEGHTDSTGPYDYNMNLSLARAQRAANFMASLGVRETRFHMMGYGPDQPVEPNNTSAGRQANRRVEIAIYANDKLKSAARKQVDEG